MTAPRFSKRKTGAFCLLCGALARERPTASPPGKALVCTIFVRLLQLFQHCGRDGVVVCGQAGLEVELG